MFYRLMRGTIFTDRDAIVREYVKQLELAQGAEAQGGLHVIGEDQESGGIGKNAAVRSHAVDCGAHGMFTHTERYVAAGITPHSINSTLRVRSAEFERLKIAFALERRVGGGVQIG